MEAAAFAGVPGKVLREDYVPQQPELGYGIFGEFRVRLKVQGSYTKGATVFLVLGSGLGGLGCYRVSATGSFAGGILQLRAPMARFLQRLVAKRLDSLHEACKHQTSEIMP